MAQIEDLLSSSCAYLIRMFLFDDAMHYVNKEASMRAK